jgi:hypothetical protein
MESTGRLATTVRLKLPYKFYGVERASLRHLELFNRRIGVNFSVLRRFGASENNRYWSIILRTVSLKLKGIYFQNWGSEIGGEADFSSPLPMKSRAYVLGSNPPSSANTGFLGLPREPIFLPKWLIRKESMARE